MRFLRRSSRDFVGVDFGEVVECVIIRCSV